MLPKRNAGCVKRRMRVGLGDYIATFLFLHVFPFMGTEGIWCFWKQYFLLYEIPVFLFVI